MLVSCGIQLWDSGFYLQGLLTLNWVADCRVVDTIEILLFAFSGTAMALKFKEICL